MKRTFSTDKHKARAGRRAKYEAKQKASHTRRLRRYQAELDEIPVPSERVRRYQPTKVLAAPKNFSFVDNTEQMIRYFKLARSWLADRYSVTFDLADVDAVSPDGIAMLIAKVRSKEFRHRRPIRGIGPSDTTAARMFDESGFYDHVTPNRLVPSENKHLLLHRITFNRVEPEIARNAGILTVRHLFGDGRKIRALYEVLIECMANTNNHAYPAKRGRYDWWLFVYNHPTERRTIFTFLDLGVGIFRSIKIQSVWRAALKRLGLERNIDIVPRLLAGEIASRTGKPERGKGIPRIYERAKCGAFSRFVLVSNNVYVDLINDKRRELPQAFNGTFFSFEITA